MIGVLTYADGKVKETVVSDPPPERFYEADMPTGVFYSGDPPPPWEMKTRSFSLTNVVPAATLSGNVIASFAEYKEDAPEMKHNEKHIEKMEKVVQEFQATHPDLKLYEKEIAALGAATPPEAHEDAYMFLSRLYNEIKLALVEKKAVKEAEEKEAAAQKKAAEEAAALAAESFKQAQDQYNAIKQQQQQLQASLLPQYSYGDGNEWTTQGSNYMSGQFGTFVGGAQVPAAKPPPKQEIPQVEEAGGRMIKLKKKEKE